MAKREMPLEEEVKETKETKEVNESKEKKAEKVVKANKGVAKVVIKKIVLNKLKLGKNYKVKVTYLTDTIKSWVKYRK